MIFIKFTSQPLHLMIPFFRNIRKKMADDNRPLKYMRYAFGEIILVVIGILIALQINYWNGNRKNNATELIFLKGLILNLDTDITALNSVISRNNGKISSITYISDLFYEQDEAKIGSPLKNHVLTMWGVEIYSNQSFVFDGIKSSGKLNLIKSDTVLFEILRYYHTSNEFLSVQQLNNSNINNLMFEPFFRNKMDINSILEPLFPEHSRAEFGDLDYSFFNQDTKSYEVKEFRNSLSGIKGVIGLNNTYLKNLRTQAINLKSLIEVYMNTNEKTIKTPLGQSHILANGKSEFHEIEIQDGADLNNWSEIDSNKINIRYPKELGYGVIRFVDSKIKNSLATRIDYSGYTSISLELKGDIGGESVFIAFLDTDDFADGSETRVPLVLSDRWETYEIDLDMYQATNFNALIESPVIVLLSEAVSFSIKNIEFKK